jgi:hypothetical protein
MRAKTREKYMTILRYMHEQNRPFSMTEVRQKAGGHSVMLSSCVKVGLVERQTKGRYKWVGDVPTKTTANRVYNNVMKSIAMKPTKQPTKQPVKRSISRPELRTASILWGLIKFNY